MSDPTPDRRIEAIAERLAKATPGEWIAGHLADDDHPCNCDSVVSDSGLMGGICTVSYDNGLPISEGGNDCPPLDEAKANLLFIAHAHQDIPWLLEDRARLESSLTQAREMMGEATIQLDAYALSAGRFHDGCSLCGERAVDGDIPHTPDCLVTKLRSAADQEGK